MLCANEHRDIAYEGTLKIMPCLRISFAGLCLSDSLCDQREYRQLNQRADDEGEYGQRAVGECSSGDCQCER